MKIEGLEGLEGGKSMVIAREHFLWLTADKFLQ